MDLPAPIETTGRHVMDVMYAIHSRFGPGGSESMYARVMARALERRGHRVEREKWIPVAFEEDIIEGALRADLVVDDAVVVELKTVNHMLPVHEAQLLTYLYHGGYPLGYLMNFRCVRMRDSYLRRVNGRALASS